MPTKKWFSTTLAAKDLGVSAKYLRENRTKLFKAGRHYRLVNPTAWRPTYRWHIDRCNQLFDKLTREAAQLESNEVVAVAGRGTQLPLVEGVDPYEIE